MADARKKQRTTGSRGRAARIAEQRRREARRRAAWIAVTAAVVVGGIALVVVSRGGGGGGSGADAPAGTETFDYPSRDHVQGSVAYDRTPPAGGDHAGVWQNCGSYPDPIGPEQGVHSMEHGAVWLTYRADLEASEVDRVRSLADGQSFVLVSLWETGLPSAVVASAWGRQLEVSSASDPRLEQFVRAFQVGPQAPEPGAPCIGGVGEPG